MASSKREKDLARQRAERQAARRAAAERKRKQRNTIIAAVLAVLVLGGAATAGAAALLGGGDTPDTLAGQPTPPPQGAPASAPPASEAPASPSPAPAPPPAAAGACTYTPGDAPARPVNAPPADPQGLDQPLVATIATNRGDITIDLLGDKAPCAVNSLRSLAGQGYFKDTPCHRLTTSGIFVLQCGDPTGTGRGGPGYAFDDENLEGATYPRGTLAMANAGAGTNGSQFFLVYKDSQLPPAYTPFGTITGGLELLDEVAAAGSTPGAGGNTAPNLPVQIKDITVAAKG